jgi:tetratricopeptide (TPR) repeat protein
VHLIMAQLCVLAADPTDDQVHLERACRLAPVNPDLLFRCGLLDFNAGRPDRAYESWRRSLTLSSRYLTDILDMMGQELETPGMVQKVLPDSPELLVRLAQKQYAADEHANLRRLLVERAEELIEQVDLPADERHHLRGSVLALKGVNSEAIKSYADAVKLRPNEVVWRYEFALLLKREGLLDEAHAQAKQCARMAPAEREYRELLEQIHEARLK